MRTNFFFVILVLAADVGISLKANASLFDLGGALGFFGNRDENSNQVIIVDAIKNVVSELVDLVACEAWDCKYLAINRIVYNLVLLVRRLTEEESTIVPRLRRYVQDIDTSLKKLEERDLERRKRETLFEPKVFDFISDEANNLQDHIKTVGGIIRKESNNVKGFIGKLVPINNPMFRNGNINTEHKENDVGEVKNFGKKPSVAKEGLSNTDDIIVEVNTPESREVVVVIDDDSANVGDI